MTTREELSADRDRRIGQRQALFDSTVKNLATAVALRDRYTGEHSLRVTAFAAILGRQLQLSARDLKVIRYGTPLHDLGKISIRDQILRKPGALTRAELEEMSTHTTAGAKIIALVPELRPALPIVRSHHERWDGCGYPDGLKGEEIPLLARVVAVADAFDAMAFDTPYRKGQAAESAFAEIERQRGQHFDPDAVTAFLKVRDRIIEAMHRREWGP